MITICMTAHQRVITDCMTSNQCECLAISVYVWQSEYVLEYVLYTKLIILFSFFVFLLLKLLLLYFSSVQIKHLYDV